MGCYKHDNEPSVSTQGRAGSQASGVAASGPVHPHTMYEILCKASPKVHKEVKL
jgi:hypothetical protein